MEKKIITNTKMLQYNNDITHATISYSDDIETTRDLIHEQGEKIDKSNDASYRAFNFISKCLEENDNDIDMLKENNTKISLLKDHVNNVDYKYEMMIEDLERRLDKEKTKVCRLIFVTAIAVLLSLFASVGYCTLL